MNSINKKMFVFSQNLFINSGMVKNKVATMFHAVPWRCMEEWS